MSGNASSSARTRHVDTRWHFMRELQDKKVIDVLFVRTDMNRSDGFTKNVSSEIHESHSKEMVSDKSEIVKES